MTCNSCGFEERCPPYGRCDEMERQSLDAMIAEEEWMATMAEYPDQFYPPDKNDLSYWL